MLMRWNKRSGYILIAVLACLSLVLALTISSLQTALRMRREVSKQHLLSQTSVLCEAGLARAVLQQQDPSYSGEIWKPTLPEIPDKYAEVSIVILDRVPTYIKVKVTAVIEDQRHSNNRVQRTIQTKLETKPSNPSLNGEKS